MAAHEGKEQGFAKTYCSVRRSLEHFLRLECIYNKRLGMDNYIIDLYLQQIGETDLPRLLQQRAAILADAARLDACAHSIYQILQDIHNSSLELILKLTESLTFIALPPA